MDFEAPGAAQKVQVQRGDILLVRTGHMSRDRSSTVRMTSRRHARLSVSRAAR